MARKRHTQEQNIRKLGEAKVLIEQWMREYSTIRPYSPLGYPAPAPEAIEIWPPGMNLLPPAVAHGLT